MVDPTQVQDKVDQIKSSGIEVGVTIGNLTIATPTDLENIAKRLERAGVAVPPHCRGNAGVIYALCLKALEWRMPIMAVLEKSYVVNNRGVERIAYESQLVHAIIERNAPLKGRLRYKIINEGDERRCVVTGYLKGEEQPFVYESETLAKLRDARGRNAEGVLKGSPLWDHQPETQLFYSASRTWARVYCPDVILGAYTPEDPQYAEIDVTPPVSLLQQRLKAANKGNEEQGFNLGHVHTVIEGVGDPVNAEQEAAHEGSDGGQRSDVVEQEWGSGTAGGTAAAAVSEGSERAVAQDQTVGEASAGHTSTEGPVEDQAPRRKPSQGKRK